MDFGKSNLDLEQDTTVGAVIVIVLILLALFIGVIAFFGWMAMVVAGIFGGSLSFFPEGVALGLAIPFCVTLLVGGARA